MRCIKAFQLEIIIVVDPDARISHKTRGRVTIELFAKLNIWDKDKRFVVTHVLKPEKDRVQLSLLKGADY